MVLNGTGFGKLPVLISPWRSFKKCWVAIMHKYATAIQGYGASDYVTVVIKYSKQQSPWSFYIILIKIVALGLYLQTVCLAYCVKISGDNFLKYFCYFFPENKTWHWMKCQTYFLQKNISDNVLFFYPACSALIAPSKTSTQWVPFRCILITSTSRKCPEKHLSYVCSVCNTAHKWANLNPCPAEQIKMPHPLLIFTNQITWSKLLLKIHTLNGKQCRSRSVGFWRSQLIWIYSLQRQGISGFSRTKVKHINPISGQMGKQYRPRSICS